MAVVTRYAHRIGRRFLGGLVVTTMALSLGVGATIAYADSLSYTSNSVTLKYDRIYVSDKNAAGKNETVGYASGSLMHTTGYCEGSKCINKGIHTVSAVTNYGKGIYMYQTGTHNSMGWRNLPGGGYWITTTYYDNPKQSANITKTNVQVTVNVPVKQHAGYKNWSLTASVKACKDKPWAINPCSVTKKV
ncbi:MAG: hypothetical protein FWD55_02975 [Propionibacteriaceae bacterium]|nr:hypothetical protein [Propionibacteriaceae bacterium]